MKIKKKTFFTICIVLAAALLLWGMWPDKPENSSQNEQNQQTDNTNNGGNQGQPPEGGIDGKLMVSNNQSRGNYMVVTDTQTIYVRTSRDFSALVGKDITMTIDGPVTNFRLLDIVGR